MRAFLTNLGPDGRVLLVFVLLVVAFLTAIAILGERSRKHD